MAKEAKIYVTLSYNRGWPTTADPRHRFDKQFNEAPWSQAVEATIYLSDSAWELLG